MTKETKKERTVKLFNREILIDLYCIFLKIEKESVIKYADGDDEQIKYSQNVLINDLSGVENVLITYICALRWK